MPGDDAGDRLDPEEAFGIFSHELRLEILLALWRAPDYSLSFSELQSAVGERDSGRFTYHLGKLEGQFVEHVDDLYELRHAGHRVIDAVRTGVFHESPTVDPVELDDDCLDCGASLAFSYADHIGTVRCPNCERKVVEYPFDPGGFQGRTDREAAAAFDEDLRHVWGAALRNLCPSCTGRVSTALVGTPDVRLRALDRYDDFFAADHPAVVSLECGNCSYYSYLPVGARLLGEPRVQGFLADHGVDVRERPLWRLPFVVDADRVTVESTDPWRVVVTAEAGGSAIEATIAADATIEGLTARL